MAKKLTVVLSQGQSKNPVKRGMEDDLAAALLMEPDVDLSIVPHLYDLHKEHTGLLFLQSVAGDMVVVSWLFPRAAHWTLDGRGVKGKVGTTLLPVEEDDEEPEEEPEEQEELSAEDKDRLGALDVPNRTIYCLNLSSFDSIEPYIEEIRRIASEAKVETVPIQLNLGTAPPPGRPAPPQHIAQPAGGDNGNGDSEKQPGPLNQWIQGNPTAEQLQQFHEPKKFDDPAKRRWHPVIDYDRCTNCMECIDFCLFGVYGVDKIDRILVDEPDNCKKGCPACSRVCPENAIIFPMHKSPEIAGAPGAGPANLKIDLSKLFGAINPIEMAAHERDAELIKAGREAVGLTVGIPKRQSGKPSEPKDDLDGLMDELDDLDL